MTDKKHTAGGDFRRDLAEERSRTFANRCEIALATDMYTPVDAKGRQPTIAVSGPFDRLERFFSEKMK